MHMEGGPTTRLQGASRNIPDDFQIMFTSLAPSLRILSLNEDIRLDFN